MKLRQILLVKDLILKTKIHQSTNELLMQKLDSIGLKREYNHLGNHCVHKTSLRSCKEKSRKKNVISKSMTICHLHFKVKSTLRAKNIQFQRLDLKHRIN